MVYERVRTLTLPLVNQITNTYDIYADQPIDGRIIKVQWNHPGAGIGPSGGGSCLIMVSGTSGTVYGVPEQILYINDVFGSSWRRYPLTYCTDSAGAQFTNGSQTTQFVCRDSLIRIIGSGMALAAGSNCGKFIIHYY